MTVDISCTRPANESVFTAQDLNRFEILSTSGSYSSILNLWDIRGNPRYLTGRVPQGNPKTCRWCGWITSLPAKNNCVLSLFTWSPDQDAKSSNVSLIPTKEEQLPSKKIITSSANMRWEIARWDVLGWYLIRPAAYLDFNKLEKTSIPSTKR